MGWDSEGFGWRARISDSEFGGSNPENVGFRVWDFGLWILGLGFRLSERTLGFRGSDLGFGV